MAITKTLNCKVDEELSNFVTEFESSNRKKIVELFEDFDEEFKPTEIELGIPTGEEIW